jgi:hypothetical protein
MIGPQNNACLAIHSPVVSIISKGNQLRTHLVPMGDYNEKCLALLSDIHFGTFVDNKQLRKIIDTANNSN